jgi:endonuclease YncB( thermonuclease family)
MSSARLRALAATAVVALLVAGGLGGKPSEPAPPSAVAGAALAVDGDTLELAGRRVRLHGIDAPERAQRCPRQGGADWDCGRAAAERLSVLLAAGTTRCAGRDLDRYGRLVAVCNTGGEDLGAVLVREGLAHAYIDYSRDYVAAEAAARAGRRGVWQGPAQAPWTFRKAARVRR